MAKVPVEEGIKRRKLKWLGHTFRKTHIELNLNSVNQLIFVMVKYGVLFEVRTEFFYTVQTSSGFKGLV
jgi:hypothetical protein